MLSVTHNDGRSEPLINIQNCEIEEEVNGAFTLSFASFFVDNPGYDLLEEESIVDLDGQEFRMTDYKQKRLSKSVSGPHVFFDLIHHRVEGIQGGTRTAEEQAAFILNGSGWTWEVQGEILPQLFLDAFGNSNAVQLIRLMCETLKCEVQIMPGKHLVFAKQIGKDDDFQFRSKYNIKDITRSVSTTDLFTAIKATGANGLTVEYRAPTWEQFKINGKPRYADPVTNEEMVTEESLLAFAEQELGDRWIPQVSTDVSVAELQEQGYEGVPGLGDRIWLIEPSMGLPLQTRVMKRKGNPFQKGKFVVTLSNIKQSFTDILTETRVEIDKNAREFRSRIEQTNQNILFEVQRLNGEFVESYAQMNILSDEINQRVRTITHEQDLQEVLSTANSYADAKAIEGQGYTDSALQTVTERLTIAESSIVQQAAMIESKVNVTTFETGLLNANAYADSVAVQALGNAQVYAETKANEARLAAEAVAAAEASLAETNANAYADGIVTDEEQARINDAAAKLTEAKQYAEQKAVEAESAANAYADGATAPIVTRITNAESSITQLSNDITSRVREDVYLVDKQNLQGDIDSLEGTTGNLSSRLYSAESSISQQAGEISSKVSYTDYNGNQVMSMLNQTATTFKMQAEKIDLTGIVRVADSIEMGTTGNGATKAIKFNGTDAWIYSQGAFNLTIDTSDLYLLGTTHVSGLDLSSASYVNWGSHAPDTVARFG